MVVDIDTPIVTSCLKSDKEVVIHQGGTYSGKTIGILIALIIIAIKSTEALTISVVGMSMPHLRRGALRDFVDILTGLGMYNKRLHDKGNQVFKIGKCRVEFFGLDSEAKVKGGKRDILFINECNHIPYAIYKQLNIRTKLRTFLDYNPDAEFWVHEFLKGNENVAFFRSTYRSNKYTPDKVIREIESYRTIDMEYYKIYGLGLTGKLEGLIFPNMYMFSEMPGIIGNEGYGLDFGFNNKLSLVHCGMSSNKLYHDELIYESNLTTSQLIDLMFELDVDPDLEMVCDSSRPEAIKELQDNGFNAIPSKKGKGSVYNGIMLMKRYQLWVSYGSSGMRKEKRNYKWKTQRKTGALLDEPVDKFNHSFDASRYWWQYCLVDNPEDGSSYQASGA